MNVISAHTIQGKHYTLVEHPEKTSLPCTSCAFYLDTRACETSPECWDAGTRINRIYLETKE